MTLKNKLKRYSAALALATGLSITASGCFLQTNTSPTEETTQTETKTREELIEEKINEIPINVDKCIEYKKENDKGVLVYKTENIFLAYNPETNDIKKYLKYNYSAKQTGFGNDMHDYIQLYDMETLELVVNTTLNYSSSQRYYNFNYDYYCDIVNNYDIISLESGVEIKPVYSAKELDELIPIIIEARSAKYVKKR